MQTQAVDNHISGLTGAAKEKALLIKYATDCDSSFFAALNASPSDLRRAKNYSNKAFAAGRAQSKEISLSALEKISGPSKSKQVAFNF